MKLSPSLGINFSMGTMQVIDLQKKISLKLLKSLGQGQKNHTMIYI